LYTKEEIKLFKRLNTPHKIQDFLDDLPQNFELDGETYYSPRTVLQKNSAHCFEGACLAAAIMQFNGAKPLLLDLRVKKGRRDVDHVVALFQINGLWGSISKTNHNCLRWRDPIYRSIRELVMSYYHEYFGTQSGLKNLQEFAGPINLEKYPHKNWQTSAEDLGDLVDYLDSLPHQFIMPKSQEKYLRRASEIEIATGKITEWDHKNKKVFKNNLKV
jgi:hypothetical protein